MLAMTAICFANCSGPGSFELAACSKALDRFNTGTTKLAHLNENLSTADLQFSQDELGDLNSAISKITIHGDRYTAEEQKRVEK